MFEPRNLWHATASDTWSHGYNTVDLLSELVLPIELYPNYILGEEDIAILSARSAIYPNSLAPAHTRIKPCVVESTLSLIAVEWTWLSRAKLTLQGIGRAHV